ncbi:MAG: hypothetical protein ACYCTV_07610 [Leptospirales bacterium]
MLAPAMDHKGQLATFDRRLLTDAVPGGELCLYLCRWFHSLKSRSSQPFSVPPVSQHKRPVTNEPSSLAHMVGNTDFLAG